MGVGDNAQANAQTTNIVLATSVWTHARHLATARNAEVTAAMAVAALAATARGATAHLVSVLPSMMTVRINHAVMTEWAVGVGTAAVASSATKMSVSTHLRCPTTITAC